MKTTHLVRTVLLLAGVWLISLPAFADAIFETLKGDVRVINPSGALAIPVRGQRVDAGASVTTGADGQALLRFDDGQAILLSPGSEFKISAYKFDRGQPAGDSIVFDLLKGALRSVSGLIGSRNAGAYALHIPQATVGIRGTDFSTVIGDQSYVSVQSGTISVANTAGTTTFSAGSFGAVSAGGLATAVSAGALPAGVSASFGSLSSVTVGAATGAGAAGGGGAAASGAAAGGGVSGAAVAAGVAAAAAIAAAGSNTQSPTTTTGTTGTTGTR
jgi:hypothetical protein